LAGPRPADVRRAPRARHLPRGRLRGDGGRVPGLRQHRGGRAAVCRRSARARGTGRVKTAGRVLLAIVVFVALAAPWLAPNPPDRQFDTYLYAPPTHLHLGGGTPYIYASR